MKNHPILLLLTLEFGRYQYTVMPFGATVAGNVFQRKLDQCFGHLKNIIVIADDIMVVGKQLNHRDHDRALREAAKHGQECNVHLNYDKLQYKQTEVNFFGKTYTVDGQKPPQSKVKAIQAMPPPQCKKQVQSLIGMVNLSIKVFHPIIRTCRAYSQIVKRKSTFNWGPEHDAAFHLIKKEITAAPILATYNP